MSCSILEDSDVWTYEFQSGSYLRGCQIDSGAKQTINFLHGNGFCSKAYWPLLKQLSPDYNLLLQDAVGHGDSDTGNGFQSWQDSADRAVEVLLKESPDKNNVIGMGHSFGGILTLLMEMKYPGLFKKIVLLDPILIPQQIMEMSSSMPNPMAAKTRGRQNSWQSREEAKQYFLSKTVYKKWTDESVDGFIDHALHSAGGGELTLKCPPDVEADIYQSSPEGLWAAIEKVDVDVHIIYGANSYSFIEGSCEQAKGLNQRISIEKIEGSHCFMMEVPDEAADKVLSWL